MSVTENIIRIRNVTKVFQMGSESIHAVDNVSLNIHKEEVCCLFGKSGSGKSTLLNLIAGLEKPTEGRILFHNKHIERMNEDQLADFRRQYVGFVFQSYHLLPTLTALENVTLPLIFKGVPVKERNEQAMEMLDIPFPVIRIARYPRACCKRKHHCHCQYASQPFLIHTHSPFFPVSVSESSQSFHPVAPRCGLHILPAPDRG